MNQLPFALISKDFGRFSCQQFFKCYLLLYCKQACFCTPLHTHSSGLYLKQKGGQSSSFLFKYADDLIIQERHVCV